MRWGVVQLSVALGAQWMQQSVLDAGLSVLSLTTGPVLGAFMVGVLTRHVGSRRHAGWHGRRRRDDVHHLVDRGPGVDMVCAGGASTTALVALALAVLPAFRVRALDNLSAVDH